jgi:hypothetical protein
MSSSDERGKLKKLIETQCAEFAVYQGVGRVHPEIIDETRHWLDVCPAARDVYVSAIDKYNSKIYVRNILDDLRLSLEILLKFVLKNNKSLENKISELGKYIKSRGGSPQLVSIFTKLVDYYSHYQNNFVKHSDSVKITEVEFVMEIASSFMKHVIRVR